MVYADLHVHTDNSDGTLSLVDIPEAAREAGVSVVAVTDHDRMHPELAAPVTTIDGVVVVNGIELRVAAPEQRVDLLAYGVSPTEDLLVELDRIQEDRIERGEAIIECVEDRLGITLDVDLGRGIGRPHIASAVVDHPNTHYEDLADVFYDLIGESDPCFVARDVPTFESALPLLEESSALVSLAHPLRYDDPAAALALCERLDAVEAYYPYDRGIGDTDGEDASLVDDAIPRYDLLETGGSDTHDRELGKAGLTKRQYDRLAVHLPTP